MYAPRDARGHDADGWDADDDDEPAIHAEINITPLTDVFLVLLIIFMVTTSAAVEQVAQQAATITELEEQVEAAAATSPKGTAGQGDEAVDVAGGGLQVDLPRSSAEGVVSGKADVVVVMAADGRVFVGEKPVDAAGLKAALRAAAERDPDTMVIVRADASLSHGKVVALMDVAGAVGLHNLSVATAPEAAP
jgi:biopolymer transport protein ExbD